MISINVGMLLAKLKHDDILLNGHMAKTTCVQDSQVPDGGYRGYGRLDRKVMTLGCSKQGFNGCCTHTHTHKYTVHIHAILSQAFWGLVGCEKADGGGHDRCLQGQLRTSPLLTASHLLHIMSATTHTASWVNPSMLPHTLRINK